MQHICGLSLVNRALECRKDLEHCIRDFSSSYSSIISELFLIISAHGCRPRKWLPLCIPFIY